MRKKIRFKSLLRDSMVSLLCLSAATFFVYLFWQDLNAFTVRSDKSEIGIISFKHNVAQRKFDDRVVWERISTGTKLYYGDTIRTADLAEAILTLSDGTVLNLGENTMIQVGSNSSGGLQISISGGDLQIDSTTALSSLELKLDDGSLVNVDAGSSLATKTDSETGVHNVEVKSGTAQITTESGETASLSYGESVNVEKGKEIQKNAIAMIYPPKELKLLNTKGSYVPVSFEWKTSGGEAVVLETSYSRDFTKITSSKEIENSSTAEVRVENGVIFWRAYPSSDKNSSVSGKLVVESLDPIEGISPAASSSFKYRNSLPKIPFRWSGNEYAERYRLLVSSSPDMKNVVLDSEITGNFTAVNELDEGTYWWQVTPFYSVNKLGYVGASEISSFTVLHSSDIRRPELSVPADNAQIVYRDRVSANFIWKSELKDSTYELLIAKDYDFDNVVYTAKTSETRFSKDFDQNELYDGTYYWKVLRSSDEPDDKNPESEIRSFRVVRYVPQDNKLLYPLENTMIEGGNVSGTAFMWKLSDEFSSKSLPAVLQISSTPNFTKIQVEKTTMASLVDNLSLSSGNYWWRVGVRDENGGISGFTPSRMFTVLSELTPPEILNPAQNQELMIYNFAPVSISWKQVEDAEYYSLKIKKSDGQIVKQADSITDTSAQYVLEEGSYICSVQAIASSTRISAPSERNFSVRAPSAILAQSPADGTRIAGLTALRNPVIFTWLSGKDKVKEYQFVLSKLQKDGSSKVVESIRTSRTTLPLNRLTGGSYSWKVVASTAGGIPLDSQTMNFIIEETPNLTSAVLESPAQNLVMDGSYFRRHRSIDFTWKEVPGATSYTFALYKVDSAGRQKLVYSKKNIKSCEQRLDDLSILDVGDFEWTVTPFSYAKDGYLEQQGRAAGHRFKIDFASPTRVENVQPGKMYGN